MKLDVSTRHGYSIATALRGLDLTFAITLKYIVTARIRWLAGACSCQAWVRECPLSNNSKDWGGEFSILFRSWHADYIHSDNSLVDGLRNELELLFENDVYLIALRHYLRHAEEACDCLDSLADESQIRQMRHTAALKTFVRALLDCTARNSIFGVKGLVSILIHEEVKIEADYIET